MLTIAVIVLCASLFLSYCCIYRAIVIRKYFRDSSGTTFIFLGITVLFLSLLGLFGANYWSVSTMTLFVVIVVSLVISILCLLTKKPNIYCGGWLCSLSGCEYFSDNEMPFTKMNIYTILVPAMMRDRVKKKIGNSYIVANISIEINDQSIANYGGCIGEELDKVRLLVRNLASIVTVSKQDSVTLLSFDGLNESSVESCMMNFSVPETVEVHVVIKQVSLPFCTQRKIARFFLCGDVEVFSYRTTEGWVCSEP